MAVLFALAGLVALYGVMRGGYDFGEDNDQSGGCRLSLLNTAVDVVEALHTMDVDLAEEVFGENYHTQAYDPNQYDTVATKKAKTAKAMLRPS